MFSIDGAPGKGNGRDVTITATIRLPLDQAREVAAALESDVALGVDAIDLHVASADAWEVGIYLARADRAHQDRLAAIVRDAAGHAQTPEWSHLAETDWVRRSQEALPSVRIGRVLVY